MKHDESTIPGGYYIGVDGLPHDAEGNLIEPKEQPESITPLNVQEIADTPKRGRKPKAD